MVNSGSNGSTPDRVAELEREIAELKSMRLLIGGLAHDFNNLLTAIQGHAAMIAAEVEQSPDLQESAAAIIQASEHASAIARKLQNLSHRGPAKREPVDLHQIIMEVVTLLKPSTNGHIEIVVDLQATNPITLADPEQMHQMLLNLGMNARESMPDGGVIEFQTSTEHGAGRSWMLLSVRDTGCGIPDDNRERIFEPFFTTREQGTGLGLAVVARIVRKHLGELRLDTGRGGSTFIIRLPLTARLVGVQPAG